MNITDQTLFLLPDKDICPCCKSLDTSPMEAKPIDYWFADYDPNYFRCEICQSEWSIEYAYAGHYIMIDKHNKP